MNAKQRAQYDTRAKILKALAHPSRLLIVDVLATEGERCVCDLTELVGSDISTVSRHLAQLKEAGIVEDDKRGQMVFYKLRVKCLTGLFNSIESVVKCNANSSLAVLAD
jgi:ArsR family transcriptional regulator